MTIEIKYNIGDRVWLLDEKGKVKSAIIHAIHYTNWDSVVSPIEEIETMYLFNFPVGRKGWYEESELYPTKEELLKSL